MNSEKLNLSQLLAQLRLWQCAEENARKNGDEERAIMHHKVVLKIRKHLKEMGVEV